MSMLNREKLLEQIRENIHAKKSFEEITVLVKRYDFAESIRNVQEENKYYENASVLLNTSYYYYLSEDETFKQHIKELTFALCNLPKWESQGARNGWCSDLGTGETCFNIGMSFYINKDIFSPSEQEFVLDALMSKGFQPIYSEWINPDTRIHCLDTMGHNWWSVCISCIGTFVLTLDDETPQKQKWLHEIVDSLKQWLTYDGCRYLNKHANWGKDGDYIEYTGYMMYALSYFVIFEELYRRSTGDISLFELTPFDKTVDFLISCLQKIENKWYVPIISDTDENIGNNYVMLYLAQRYNRGELLDLYENIGLKKRTAKEFIFLETLSVSQKPIEFKSLSVFPHTGIAFMHGDNDLMFSVKTGETGCHNHRDNGTFTLSYRNKELIIDSGKCPYAMKEYLDYFCAPEAHNVITFNGEGIRADGMYGGGVAAMGEIASYIDKPGYKYLLADCTKPYLNILQRNMRHIIMLESVIFIIDDIYAENDGYAEFLLHYAGEASSKGNEITVKNGDVSAKILSILPNKQEISVKDGFLYKNGKLVDTKYFSIKGNTQNKRMKFITAILLDENVKIEQKARESTLEMSIDRDNFTERIIINMLCMKENIFNNARIEYDNIKTNAFITYLKEKENNLLESSIINGYYLYHNEKRVYLSMKNSDVFIK